MFSAFNRMIGGFGEARLGSGEDQERQDIGTWGGIRDRKASIPVTDAPEPTLPYTKTPGRSKSGQRGYWHTYPNGRRVFVRT